MCNVTTSGVKGYEYQYKVTVAIALIALLKNNSKLFIESTGGEDAELNIIESHCNLYYEIQIKREKSLIDFKKLADWLCHFQERKSDNNLIHRIFNYSNRVALFITQSRCSDEIVRLKSDILDINIHSKIEINKIWKAKFLNSIKNNKIDKPSTNLQKKRNEFCESLSNNLSNLSDVLKRIIIWEEISDADLENKIFNKLNKDFKIPQSLVEDIFFKIMEEIKLGRDNKHNILPNILKIINKYQINTPKISNIYQNRDEEQNLLIDLENKGIILLTGISFCGKSELAKKLAISFTDKGFNYLNTNEISDLEHFFNNNKIEDKIAILEDPWGHILINEDSHIITRKLKNIIGNKVDNHKIIVTSRIEILNELNNTQILENSKINQIKWSDLTIKDNTKLINYWSILVKNKNILLETDKEFSVQFGQLNHLSNMDKSELDNKSIDELLHISRVNSKELADNLRKNNDLSILMCVLSLTCNTTSKVKLEDLIYIFSNDENEYSIFERESFYLQEALFPKYENKYKLDEKIENLLQLLEERGYVSIIDDEISFNHPNYFEAGRYLLLTTSSIKQKKVFKFLKRCISCLNYTSSYLTSKQFTFLYNNLLANSEKENLIKIAFYGLKSIFPSVVDISLVFLTSIFSELTLEQQQELTTKIQLGYTHDTYIFWHNDFPFITSKFLYRSYINKNLNLQYIESIIEKINLNKNISLKQIWEMSIFLEDPKVALYDEKTLLFLLQTNEVFIRANIVYLITSKLRNEDFNLIIKIFSDDHPSVIFKAISGLLHRWVKLPLDLKNKILPLLIQALNNKSVAIRAYNLISTFGIDYGHESLNWRLFLEPEKKELWNLWGILFPICSSNIPLSVSFNSGRFGVTMDKSIKYLTSQNAIEVAKAWFDRIDYKLKTGSSIDDYELSFSDYLIEIEKDDNNSIMWNYLFDLMINYNDTSFILSSLKWIVRKWSFLEQNEKEKILNLLKSSRKDLRWIKATLLNTYNPPKEIIKEILEDENIFEKDTTEILSIFPRQLLEDCLSIYSGNRHIYYLALHNQSDDFWIKIMKFILLTNFDYGFDESLSKMLSSVLNSPSNEWDISIRLWNFLCLSPYIKKEKLFDELLKWTILYNSIECSKYWEYFFLSFINCDEKKYFAQKIIENIDLIEGNHSDNLLEKLGEYTYFDEILPLINPDQEIFSYLEEMGGIRNIKDYTTVINKIKELIFNETPKSKPIRDVINNLYKKANLNIKIEPNYSKINISEKINVFRDELELEDWIYIKDI